MGGGVQPTLSKNKTKTNKQTNKQTKNKTKQNKKQTNKNKNKNKNKKKSKLISCLTIYSKKKKYHKLHRIIMVKQNFIFLKHVNVYFGWYKRKGTKTYT